ncbi:MAG: hypothetical protein AAF928_02645 [Myxococcota bacterium]
MRRTAVSLHRSSGSALVMTAAALAVGVMVSTFAPSEAHAQDVSPTGKGITGGALLGSEVALITVGAIGVKTWWPYVVFGAVGAGGGAVGGYFVEQVDEAEPSLYMLAGGLALVVPTVVVVLNATAYDPESDLEGDDDAIPPGEEPGLEGGVDVEIGWADPAAGRASSSPPALFDVDATGARTRYGVGLPVVHALPRFSAREIATFGVQQQTEVRVPLVRGRF